MLGGTYLCLCRSAPSAGHGVRDAVPTEQSLQSIAVGYYDSRKSLMQETVLIIFFRDLVAVFRLIIWIDFSSMNALDAFIPTGKADVVGQSPPCPRPV